MDSFDESLNAPTESASSEQQQATDSRVDVETDQDKTKPESAVPSRRVSQDKPLYHHEPLPENAGTPVQERGVEVDQDDSQATPSFPQLSFNPTILPDAPADEGADNGEDEEPNVAKSFDRSSSPADTTRQSRDAADDAAGEERASRMHKYTLYETASRYYLVGIDLLDKRYKILKIDRTSDSGDLSIAEEDIVYTKKEMNRLLDAIDDGNKSSGGLKFKCSTWGILGFIRFTGPYYMLLITKRSQVAMIGGHYIYKIDGTDLIPLTSSTTSRLKSDKNPEEARFIAILNNLHLSRSFYFSYSYNLSRTLQHNVASERQAFENGHVHPPNHDNNAMFVWNQYLLEPASKALNNPFDWCLPITHGYVDQSTLSVYGRLVYITIIARRSRFFAGARFLKRGANDLGYVANDVETEQIVSEMLTTSFHTPNPDLYANPLYTSYVQHRGSIPLYWTQDNTGVTPKPDIELNLVDPFYSAAALHFNNLFERYGAPIYVLNLIKARERTPRESKLLKEYTHAINYLNQFLPEGKKIIHKAWDMSRASKSRDQDVINTLEEIAEDIIPKTGFFQNGVNSEGGLRMQNGIARTNCIDCLDRTNAAQFVVGKRALGHQLHALGIIEGTNVDYDTDAINLFTNMWEDHGDTIATQYGGSHLVNTMATYRKINQWTSHSRDMVESFKRYYNNSFLDAQRQEAYNLFLGNYVFSKGRPMLWDLSTDYYLHHKDPRANDKRNSYIHWYDPEFLEERHMPPAVWPIGMSKKKVGYFDDYWSEYYRPLAVSSFSKVFAFKMNSTLRYLPFRSTQGGRYDLSPFVVRATHEPESRERRPQPRRKGVTIQEPPDDRRADTPSSTNTQSSRFQTSKPLQNWLNSYPTNKHSPAPASALASYGIIKQPHFELASNPMSQQIPSMLPANSTDDPSKPRTKAEIAQLTLGERVKDSLNPSVTPTEAEEYTRYINHPLKVPLVVTSENALTTAASIAEGGGSNLDLLEYANKQNYYEDGLDPLADESVPDYMEFLNVGEDALTVVMEDHDKKRYKRYRQWLKGKSLFKQRVDG